MFQKNDIPIFFIIFVFYTNNYLILCILTLPYYSHVYNHLLKVQYYQQLLLTNDPTFYFSMTFLVISPTHTNKFCLFFNFIFVHTVRCLFFWNIVTLFIKFESKCSYLFLFFYKYYFFQVKILPIQLFIRQKVFFLCSCFQYLLLA